MANATDRVKLNECLNILDTTDLGLSLVWLWTWSIIKDYMVDEEWECTQTEEELWDHLVSAVASGYGFGLEYGAEQIREDILSWMLDNDYLIEGENDDSDDE